MQLIPDRTDPKSVSLDSLVELEKTIGSDSIVRPAKLFTRFQHRLFYLLYRVIKNVHLPVYQMKPFHRFSRIMGQKHFMVAMMGLDIPKSYPSFLIPFRFRSIYLFDAWPKDHDRILQFVKFFAIDFVFVSSSTAANSLKIKSGLNLFHWIPEGINAEEYTFCSIADKNIDVLALGRRYDNYHDSILNFTIEKNLVYLYEKVKGEIIFPTREALIEGLARSKVSICVPSSITHPDRSGPIETMTIRYLQSMISKCLIIGHAPHELIELFGYNPVVEIDMTNPVQQLDSILMNYSDYLPLIERNYQTVLQNHTWLCRWNQIKTILTQKQKD